ncbi:MAG: hypothetical protein HQ568_05895 [Calditrichaeota bacterium]|nr:hypothetical protein [Calditrichota bacterium]
MRRVICVITLILILSVIYGCRKSEKVSDFNLPEKIEHAERGKINFITPKALVDSINSGVKLKMFFLYEDPNANLEYFVDIPGMQRFLLSDMFYATDTLSINEPVYLFCTWGDDGKKIGEMIAKDGFNSYYLDGGTYRLLKEMQENGWIFQPETKN